MMRNTALACLVALLAGTAHAQMPTLSNTPGEQRPEQRGEFIEWVREHYADRLAGMWWEEDSRGSMSGRIFVRLTGDEAVPQDLYQVVGRAVEVVFQTGATHTLAELRAAQNRFDTIGKYISPLLMSYPDEKTGELVLGIAIGDDAAKRNADALAAELGVPLRLIETEPARLDAMPVDEASGTL